MTTCRRRPDLSRAGRRQLIREWSSGHGRRALNPETGDRGLPPEPWRPNPNGADAGCEPVVRAFNSPRPPHRTTPLRARRQRTAHIRADPDRHWAQRLCRGVKRIPRGAHNSETAGSTPAPATKGTRPSGRHLVCNQNIQRVRLPSSPPPSAYPKWKRTTTQTRGSEGSSPSVDTTPVAPGRGARSYRALAGFNSPDRLHAHVPQTEEGRGRGPRQCGFDSRRGHAASRSRRAPLKPSRSV